MTMKKVLSYGEIGDAQSSFKKRFNDMHITHLHSFS